MKSGKSNHNKTETLKIVVIGDAEVGKTSLIHSFVYQAFPDDCLPTVFDSYQGSLHFNGKKYTLNIIDTPGQCDLDQIRKVTYEGAHAIILCFAIDSPQSFENIRAFWWPEIKNVASTTPLILVGTKNDMRLSRMLRYPCVTYDAPQSLIQSLPFRRYCECSAIHGRGVDDVFSAAVSAVVTPSPKKRKCEIL